MPRFVILTHDHPFLHWDLMLEDDFVLRTWRLLSSPDSAHEIVAEQLPDHRLFYLDYEGPVSNNRGNVKRYDAGDYEIVEEDERLLILSFNGSRLLGKWILRLKLCSGNNEQSWSFDDCSQ